LAYYHDIFNPDLEEVAEFKRRYRRGKVGNVEVKRSLARAINTFLEPMRERRVSYESQPGLVEDILAAGTARVRAEARETLKQVKDGMGLYRLPASSEQKPRTSRLIRGKKWQNGRLVPADGDLGQAEAALHMAQIKHLARLVHALCFSP
jgi:hypothetical protein